jgi:hypothetical protein
VTATLVDSWRSEHQVPQALRAAGLTVHTMAEVYGEQAGQRLKDEVWLEDVGRRGWIVLMKGDAIRRRPHGPALCEQPPIHPQLPSRTALLERNRAVRPLRFVRSDGL